MPSKVAVIDDLVQYIRMSFRIKRYHHRCTKAAGICADLYPPVGGEPEICSCCPIRAGMPEMGVSFGGELFISALIRINTPNKVSKLAEVGNIEFFAGHQVDIAVHDLLIERIGVCRGRNPAMTAPCWEITVTVAVFVEYLHPWAIRGGWEDRIPISGAEILGNGGKTL